MARGEFVKASQGQRLGYTEDLGKWTAAAVYRAPAGNVQAFVGASERMAATTSYRLFSKDRDVFFDGNGPQRDYTVVIPGGTGYMTIDQRNAERVVSVSWGADVQPAIGGRYIIVNRDSGLVLEVPGASAANGVQLDQATYTGASNQKWDVYLLPNVFGGDFSYYTMAAAHDGVTADLNNWSYANGEKIQQWNGGTNTLEQWFLQYTDDGYFKIKSRWSGKCMGVSGASKSAGAQIVQWDDADRPDQQWRFIPATVAAYDFAAPAAPADLAASANAVSVRLTWTANSEGDFAGYSILRSTNSGGPYEIVARGLTATTFTDKSANQAKRYYYVARAVDRSLNTSTNSPEVSATPSCAPALLARYSLNGNPADASPNVNRANVVGSPAYVTGKYGSALDLNGTSQYAMAPAGLMASATNFTIAMWVNWDGGAAWQRIFDFGNDTTQYMFLTPSSGNGTLRFAVTTNGAAAEQIVQTAPLATNKWQHIAVTRSGNIVRLYTNAVLAASGTVTISPASFDPAINYFGDSQFEADPNFNGRLDEIFIYNYALNASEIAALANNQPPPVLSTLTAAQSGDTLQLSWPGESLGAHLESNTISPGASANWTPVAGSTSTTTISIPIDRSNTNVFFRLGYP